MINPHLTWIAESLAGLLVTTPHHDVLLYLTILTPGILSYTPGLMLSCVGDARLSCHSFSYNSVQSIFLVMGAGQKWICPDRVRESLFSCCSAWSLLKK